jgi:hypothetical protein
VTHDKNRVGSNEALGELAERKRLFRVGDLQRRQFGERQVHRRDVIAD